MAKPRKPQLMEAEFERLRESPQVEAFLVRVASRVAAAAGPGFEVQDALSAHRSRRRVVPTTDDAYRANRAHYAAIRALGQAAE